MTVVKVNEIQYYLDRYMLKNLDYVKDKVKHNKDSLIALVDGRPGSGKSTGIWQFLNYLSDGRLTLDNCVFNLKDFKDKIDNAKPFEPIWLDEGFEFNKRKSRSQDNFDLLGTLQKARAKQLFIFIALPVVYDLDKNVILSLAQMFIHFHRQGDFGKRGFYKVYDSNGMKRLWLFCSKDMTYNDKKACPRFFAHTTKAFYFDQEAYEKKKFLAKPIEIPKETKEQYNRKKWDMHQKFQKENPNATNKDESNFFGVSLSTIAHIRKPTDFQMPDTSDTQPS